MSSRRQFIATVACGAAAAIAVPGRAQVATAPATVPATAPSSSPSPKGKLQQAFGLNLHLDRFSVELRRKQLAMARAMGVQWIRGVSAAWYYVEHKPGKRDYGRPDSQLESLEQFGMKTVGGLGYAPAWSSQHDPNREKQPWGLGKYPPDDIKAWSSFVHDTVARYRGRIDVWSTWNEPDSRHFFFPEPPKDFSGDNEAFLLLRRQSFMDLQRAAYAAAKKANPDCILLSGAFAVGGTRTDLGFVRWCIENGLADACDAVDLHTYWSTANLRKVVTDARTWMKQQGKERPIWMTEFGAGLREDKTWIGEFSHEQIQSFVPKALATAQALGVERVFWYQGYTDGSNPTPLEKSNYSLNVTAGPTPAAWSFMATAPILGPAEYIGDATMETKSGKARAYRFRTDAGELVIAWADHPDGLDNRSATAEAVLNTPNGPVPLTLSERPTMLLF